MGIVLVFNLQPHRNITRQRVVVVKTFVNFHKAVGRLSTDLRMSAKAESEFNWPTLPSCSALKYINAVPVHEDLSNLDGNSKSCYTLTAVAHVHVYSF
jgi:hypothetical protein